MVYRMELTYDEIVEILDVKNIARSTTGYTMPPGVYEIADINSMMKSLLPNKVKAKITIDDFRLKSNPTTDKTIRFTKNSSFLNGILGFTQTH